MPASWMVRLFGLTLALYPRALREEFGEEMTLVFEEQISDARHDGWFAVACVWKATVGELLSVAVPSRLAPIAAPAIAWITALVLFIGMIGLIPLARSH